MAVTVVTGCWGPKRARYSTPFISGFEAYWPTDVQLAMYVDEPVPYHGRARLGKLIGTAGWVDFIDRHDADPTKTGRCPAPGALWKHKALREGYNFRFDAVRFAGQAFAPEDAAVSMRADDILCWFDADVVTTRPIPRGWIESLIGDADGAYLGREPKHSEIGFWAVRINARTRALINGFADLYRSDDLFRLKEWHSAYAWDFARREAHLTTGVRMRNLTPGGSGHVWLQSPLATYTRHDKGDRKGFR